MQVMRHVLNRRGLLQGALALSAKVLSTPGRALAGAYPTKPVRFLVGAPAGTAPDVSVRIFADALAATVSQSIVVENRPGPGGITAMKALVGSEPDGYTLGLATMNQIVFDSYLFPGLPYDPVKDLAPITLLFSTSNAIAVQKSFAADNFAELVAAARARPGKLNVGTAPPGTPPQIFAHVLTHIVGIDVSYITYRSGLDGLAGLMRGEVQVLVDAPVIMMPEVKAGTIKVLAVTSREREHELPAVPTLAEAGYPATESEPWAGLVAPSRTPAELVAWLNRAALSALASPKVRQRFDALGITPRGTTPEEFRGLISRERARWGVMMHDADIRVD
jgi:tripartite-type tricarboxylate transporter receptor subunit TctC